MLHLIFILVALGSVVHCENDIDRIFDKLDVLEGNMTGIQAKLYSLEDKFQGMGRKLEVLENSLPGPEDIVNRFPEGICTFYDLKGGFTSQVVYQEIDSQLEEVAQGKTTYGTPGYPPHSGMDYVPSNAVDGLLDIFYSSDYFINPWWLVDLGENRLIYQIQIYPRRDNPARFHDIEVHVGNAFQDFGDFSAYNFMCAFPKGNNLGNSRIQCSTSVGVVGKYVGIKKITTDKHALEFAEVKVFAQRK